MSLFDQVNLAEISHPDYPGERLIACRNPALATERARKRLALLESTDTELAKVAAAAAAGRLCGADAIGLRVGRVIGRYKMAKHYHLDITNDAFTYTRNTAAISAEDALDGIYVIRTSVGVDQMDPATVVATYKSLAGVGTPTSAASRPSTWTSARSTTGPRPGSAPTCSCACWPPTCSGTCARPGRH